MAIKQNSNDATETKNSIATLYHCTNFQYKEPRHLFCLKGKNSWCKWQSDIATGKQTYKKKLNLSVAIMNEIKLVFQDLSDVKMLEKCLHGMTQNCNESLNQLIWNRSQKNIFTSKKKSRNGCEFCNYELQ